MRLLLSAIPVLFAAAASAAPAPQGPNPYQNVSPQPLVLGSGRYILSAGNLEHGYASSAVLTACRNPSANAAERHCPNLGAIEGNGWWAAMNGPRNEQGITRYFVTKTGAGQYRPLPIPNDAVLGTQGNGNDRHLVATLNGQRDGNDFTAIHHFHPSLDRFVRTQFNYEGTGGQRKLKGVSMDGPLALNDIQNDRLPGLRQVLENLVVGDKSLLTVLEDFLKNRPNNQITIDVQRNGDGGVIGYQVSQWVPTGTQQGRPVYAQNPNGFLTFNLGTGDNPTATIATEEGTQNWPGISAGDIRARTGG